MIRFTNIKYLKFPGLGFGELDLTSNVIPGVATMSPANLELLLHASADIFSKNYTVWDSIVKSYESACKLQVSFTHDTVNYEAKFTAESHGTNYRLELYKISDSKYEHVTDDNLIKKIENEADWLMILDWTDTGLRDELYDIKYNLDKSDSMKELFIHILRVSSNRNDIHSVEYFGDYLLITFSGDDEIWEALLDEPGSVSSMDFLIASRIYTTLCHPGNYLISSENNDNSMFIFKKLCKLAKNVSKISKSQVIIL